MAKTTWKMPDEFLIKISRLQDKTDEIVPKVLAAGAEIVEDKVRENLKQSIGHDTKQKSRSTGQLISALGTTKARQDRKKRAAAYCRVSTNTVAQEHSFKFQEEYWKQRLVEDPEYEYVGMFADQGISGKFEDRRPQYMAMLEACRAGKIDVIFTKSVQRFARNKVELLKTVHELRDMGVAIIFEKENINTLNPDCELFLTIAAAIAEDDLTRYSQNVTWTIRDRCMRGEVIYSYRLYGYIVVNSRPSSFITGCA